MASTIFTPSIQRVFANNGDYILRNKTAPSSFVYFEDSRPLQATPIIAICLPGIGDTRRQMRLLAPLLHDQLQCRVLLGDLRGFGDSTDFEDEPSKTYTAYSPESVADDAIQLMDELHALHPDSKFLLLGNSLAAAAMTIAANERPELTRALVWLGPIVRDSPADKWFRPLSHVMFPSLYGRAIWIPYYKTLYPGIKPSDWDSEIELLDRHLRAKKSNISNVGKFCRATKLQSEKAVEALGKRQPQLPVLAFFGRKDPDYADFDKELEWTRHVLPQIQIEVEDEGGHYPHLEVPGKVISAIKGMLNA
jgi:pimeloyl-ACP methyl ester carboxylesterase